MTRLLKSFSFLGITVILVTVSVIYLDLFHDDGTEPSSNMHLMDRLNMIHREQRVIISKSQATIDQEIAAQLEPKKEGSTNDTQFSIRDWFDNQLQTKASMKSFAGHPFFQGFVIINSGVCKNKSVDILIYVQSNPDHYDLRNVIRNTWGDTRMFCDISVRIIFVLGKPLDPELQIDIEMEHSIYGDIVQGKFNDTFGTLTYKAITTLIWINEYCPQAKVILKADDDIFVDLFRVVEEFIPLLGRGVKNIVCDFRTNLSIVRDPKNKWYIHPKYLPNAIKWPPFCSGYFTLMTGDLVSLLYERSFQPEKFVPTDDVYLYGILTDGMSGINVTNVHDKISYLGRPDPNQEIKANGRFEFLTFETPRKATELWNLKLHMLTEWEREHSLYVKLFKNGKKSVVIE